MHKVAPGVFAVLLLAGGCGYVGDPLPPLANVPGRITGLTATQEGARIAVQFAVPPLTTEGVPIKEPLMLELRIGPGGAPFHEDEWAAGARPVPVQTTNGKARGETSSTAWTGTEVVVGARAIGSNKKESGWSFVVLPVVAPPPQPRDVRAEMTAQGVRLTWQAGAMKFRVFRRADNQEFSALADTDKPEYTDSEAKFGQSYSYLVRGIVPLSENREAESDPSAAATIVPRDIVPPAAPAGLRASAAPNSIELSWNQNTESDLAGYRIYRSGPGEPLHKLADTGLLPAYSDRAVERGKTYQYSISAVDQSGNESARGAPVRATLE